MIAITLSVALCYLRMIQCILSVHFQILFDTDHSCFFLTQDVLIYTADSRNIHSVDEVDLTCYASHIPSLF